MDTAKMKKVCGLATCLFAGLLLQAVYAQGPDTVILNDMAQYYEPVEFDHAMHVAQLGDDSCATCHHHTVGTPLVDENCKRCHASSKETDLVACRDCHAVGRFSAEYLAEIESSIHLYHQDKPGLKGAFHQRCLGCHREMDAATDCQVCHARTKEGDKFFHAGRLAQPAPPSSAH